MRHPKLLKQNNSKLFRRIDIKRFSRQIIDLFFQLHNPAAQLIAIGFQRFCLDAHPCLFHIKQRKYKRHLDVIKETVHARFL